MSGIKLDQDIDVTVRAKIVSQVGPEKGQLADVVGAAKLAQIGQSLQAGGSFSWHALILP